MGVSTDGQICYGVKFEEGYEFPWDIDHDGDIEEWWLAVKGFKPSVEVYDSDGEYINGIEPEESVINNYYQEKRDFVKANPRPVEEVNYCSGNCPMYILAIPSSCKSNSRGYPESFKPEELAVTDEEKSGLAAFIEEYELEPESEPGWWLSSYYG